jgi:hypothetical protein
MKWLHYIQDSVKCSTLLVIIVSYRLIHAHMAMDPLLTLICQYDRDICVIFVVLRLILIWNLLTVVAALILRRV